MAAGPEGGTVSSDGTIRPHARRVEERGQGKAETLRWEAGGYGLLARLMRDLGFDCHGTDKYCDSLFAREVDPGPDFKADALFAMEVLEHIEDPLGFVGRTSRDTDARLSCFRP